MLFDHYGRCLTYLRLSVTDRCNLRCIYCSPQHSFSWMPHDKLLRYEEILTIARVLGQMGIRKIRLTGGEPLVRSGIVGLAKGLVKTPGINEVCLTTNGTLLEEMARDLFEAGIRHINISLDTLDPQLFSYIVGRDLFHRVWTGLMKVIELGFSPIKLNTVVMKGINDHEIEKIASLCLEYPIQVRFIEFMPIGKDSRWSEKLLLPCHQIKDRVQKHLGRLDPLESPLDSGPAINYSINKALGSVGFISPLSHHFCKTCNRLRLTSDGRLRLCLFSDHEIDVKSALRKGMSSKELTGFFRKAVQEKPRGYMDLGKDRLSCKRSMSTIGG